MKHSERVRQFFQNALAMTAAAILMRTVGVAFSAYLSRRVGAEGLGLYELVMSVYGFAVTLATSGIHLAVTRLLSEEFGKGNPAGAHAVLRRAFCYAGIFGGLSTFLLTAGAPFIAHVLLEDERATLPVAALGISMLPMALTAVLNGALMARRRPIGSAGAAIAEQGVRILLTVVLLGWLLPLGTGPACLAIVLAGSGAEICSFLILWIGYRRRSKRQPLPPADRQMPVMKRILGIALPIAWGSYVRSGLLTVEHLLIPRALTAGGRDRDEALASYGVLSGMAMPLLLYPTAFLYSFTGLLVPEFAERHAAGDLSGMRRLCRRAMYPTFVFGLLTACFFFIAADALANGLYHNELAAHFIRILAPLAPLMFLDHLTDCILKGIGEHVFCMWVNIGDSLLSILLVLVLVPPLGAVGYALVILIAETMNFLLSFGRLLVCMRPGLSARRMLFPAIGASFAITLTCILFPAHTPAVSFAASLFCLALTALCCFAFREYPRRRCP